MAGLVTKRRTDQVAATGPMPWIESNWAYDTLGRVTSQTVQKGANVGGAPEQVAQQVLAYLGNDDPASLVHTMGAGGTNANSKTFTFGYDWRHQLTSTVASQTARGVAPYVSAGTAFSGTYGYGNAGRLTRANVGVGAGALTGRDVKVRDVDYCYDSVDKEQVAALKVANASPCTGAVYASYVYDAAGNQIQRAYPAGSPAGGGSAETFDYVYDGEDRLRRVTKKVSGVVTGSEEYWYDEQGARVGVLKRGPTGTKEELRWFIGDTQAHYDAAGVVTKVYSHLSLGTPIARVERTGNANTATAVEYQFHGLASNTLAAVASDGVVNANMAYAPYGELIEGQQASAAVGLPAHRRRMNDKYVDELGGLAYYGARYYDNVLIGWTQADPKYRFAPDAAWKEPRRGNLYMFTLGNPVSYIDPDGRDVVFAIHDSGHINRPEARSQVYQALNNVERATNRIGGAILAGGTKATVVPLPQTRSILDKNPANQINVNLTDSAPGGDNYREAAQARSGRQAATEIDAVQTDGYVGHAGESEVAIDLAKVDAGIQGIRANGTKSGLSKRAIENKVAAFVQGVVDHELAHPAGAKHGTGLMAQDPPTINEEPLSPASKEEIQKKTEERVKKTSPVEAGEAK